MAAAPTLACPICKTGVLKKPIMGNTQHILVPEVQYGVLREVHSLALDGLLRLRLQGVGPLRDVP